MKQLKLISEQVVMDVMQINRSVEQLYYLTALVKQFVSWFLLKMQKLKKQEQQALILLEQKI